ncbi:hypothetical protein AB0B85_01675, partial [Micromonospora sp. NPDC049044]|uniref:hypothetical protein n=1 Tax=Micromonospora sp. NPDC049044 TaxID=3154827 RepID=UPI0033F7747F
MTDRPNVVTWWYYAISGVVAGVAIVAVGLLPQRIVGFFLLPAAMVVGTATEVERLRFGLSRGFGVEGHAGVGEEAGEEIG